MDSIRMRQYEHSVRNGSGAPEEGRVVKNYFPNASLLQQYQRMGLKYGAGDGTGSTSTGTSTTPATVGDTAYMQAYKAALDSAKNAELGKINSNRYDALRDAYITNQLGNRNMMQQIGAAGYTGGATNTEMANNQASYQNRRNDIYNNAATNAANVENSYGTKYAEELANYTKQMQAAAQEMYPNEYNTKYKELLKSLI